MNIQSLSIAVPAGCPNKCAFGVCHMHRESYTNQIEKNKRFEDLYEKDYMDALAFARDNGCNTLMFTGNGEPLMNKSFMSRVATMNSMLDKPFRNIELQTCGVGLDDETLRWLRNKIRVKVISLSLSSFSSDKNAEINRTPDKLKVDIPHLIEEIKKYDFTLRLSLNINKIGFEHTKYVDFEAEPFMLYVFSFANMLGVNQITFRQLYANGNSEEAEWVYRYGTQLEITKRIETYIRENGRFLERLPFGASRYSYRDISVVVDSDCMNTEAKEDIKYLILREDCKLYTKWDDKGSVLF